MYASAISMLLYGFASVRAIINSLKLLDYLPVHTHKPNTNLHLSNTVTTQQADSPCRLNVGREGTTKLRGLGAKNKPQVAYTFLQKLYAGLYTV